MAISPKMTPPSRPTEKSDGAFIARFFKKGDVDMIEIRRVSNGELMVTVPASTEWHDDEGKAMTYAQRVAGWSSYPKPAKIPAPPAPAKSTLGHDPPSLADGESTLGHDPRMEGASLGPDQRMAGPALGHDQRGPPSGLPKPKKPFVK